MVREKVIITNEEGLHARPAARYLQEAIKYQSKITLIKGDKEYDGKSILSILSMGAYRGSEIILQCEGEDEIAALENLKDFLENEL